MICCFVLIGFASPIFAQMSVTLAWDASPSPDIAEYRLYQSEILGKTSTAWEQIGVTAPSELTFTFTVSNASANYSWIVTAVDSLGQQSFPSNPTVKIKAPPERPGNANRR